MPQREPNLPTVYLPPRACTDVAPALRREWLVTNAIGGFASGTIAGALTRRYHGLLFAALRPPLGRTLLVAKLDGTLTVAGADYALHTNVWKDGVGATPGCQWLRRFDLVLGVPRWSYELPGEGGKSAELRVESARLARNAGRAGSCRLVQRIWMEAGQNTTYVRYELDRHAPRAVLAATLLVNFRDYHALRQRRDSAFEIGVQADGLRLRAADGGPPVYVGCWAQRSIRGRWQATGPAAAWITDQTWWRDFRLPVEEARGFEHFEDHLCAGRCRVALEPGQAVTFVLAAEREYDPDGAAALRRCQNRAQERLAAFERCVAEDTPSGRPPSWPSAVESSAGAKCGSHMGATPLAVQQLVLAADQFIVARPAQASRPPSPASELATPNSALSIPPGYTVLAGYPWFTDWGRDTMIALPGLTLCTGRFDVAREILRTWAGYVDRGMIPNRFPDRGDTCEYHTADATLWYLWAIDQYARATGDRQTLAELFPVMTEIVAWHRRGTRHNLHLDADGLIYAGEPGVNLTWMDVKTGDRVVTPRMGKPIELSALWYDGLRNLARLGEWLGKPAVEFERLAAHTRRSFVRYWNRGRACCYDVLDGPAGNDATLRPNQIFAVSLTHSPLLAEQQRAVVSVCQRELLTWFGLRSLGPREPGYRGRYAGDPLARDEAYHQGTVWGWLLGPCVIAHYRVHRDAARARQWLEPMLGQLWAAGVGSLSEVFDGDPPHEPEGCIAQAWSVAETLRAWRVTQGGWDR